MPQWLATGQWFSLRPPVCSTNKTDRHDIAEILMKVALNIFKQTNNIYWSVSLYFFSDVSCETEDEDDDWSDEFSNANAESLKSSLIMNRGNAVKTESRKKIMTKSQPVQRKKSATVNVKAPPPPPPLPSKLKKAAYDILETSTDDYNDYLDSEQTNQQAFTGKKSKRLMKKSKAPSQQLIRKTVPQQKRGNVVILRKKWNDHHADVFLWHYVVILL